MNTMKSNINQYYDATKGREAHNNIKEFLKLNIEPSNAIDLGCGAGRDTIELIKNKWHVLSIDKENNEKLIREQLSNEEQDKFEFYQSLFGSMILPKCKLIVANFSLPFTKVEFFKETWNKIESSLLDEGYFVGNFFGKKDSWISDEKRKLVFLEESEDKNLFDNFIIVKFNEIEKDVKLVSGKEKHWHLYEVIARKVKLT